MAKMGFLMGGRTWTRKQTSDVFAEVAMFISKLKLVLPGLAAAGLVVAGTAWTMASLPAGQADEKPPAPKLAPKKEQKPKTDLEKMQGAWKVVYRKKWGTEFGEQRKEALAAWESDYLIRGNSFVIRDRIKILEGTFKLDSAANPKTIDVTIGKASETRK